MASGGKNEEIDSPVHRILKRPERIPNIQLLSHHRRRIRHNPRPRDLLLAVCEQEELSGREREEDKGEDGEDDRRAAYDDHEHV